MPDDGVVTVRVSSRAVAAVQSVGGVELAPGTYQLLEVTDTGTGIPKDVRLRLFEPFFTTKESNRGSGMGLAVCHGIAVQHAGAIDVRSAPERGTTFEVWLPVGLEDAPAIAAAKIMMLRMTPLRRFAIRRYHHASRQTATKPNHRRSPFWRKG